MLARLIGKSDVYGFKIEIFGDVKTFDFLKVEHHEHGDILTQVLNISRDGDKLLGDCKIIGFCEHNILKNIRTPFSNDAKIEIADDEFIISVIGLADNGDAFIGILEHHPDLRIKLDLKKTITKHIAILAKSGAGKSYTVGVLLEEIIKKNIPIIILDPHNEYSSLKYPNTDKRDLKRLEKFNLKPEGFLNKIKEYSPDTKVNSHCEPITLDISKLKPQDLIDSLPQKITPAQQSLLFNILSNLNNKVDFDELIFNISNEESNSKWSLITLIEQLKKLRLYSATPTPLHEIVKYKRASIISLKGVDPYVQEAFVTGLLKDLFEARKKEEIPPFFLVLEEAHNFCPETSMGKVKSSNIIRTLAGEGRKFGIGLCVISQRPAKVDKNVISQCSTQILLKMTNPNDLKSVTSSAEGVDSSSENEIQRLNIGTCLLTGVIDIPLKVNIRPRISKHGGETVDITLPYEVNDNQTELSNSENNDGSYSHEENLSPANENKKTFLQGEHSEFIQFIAPEIEPEDAKVMLDSNQIEVQLLPAVLIKLKSNNNEVTILFDLKNQMIIKTLFPFEGNSVPKELLELSDGEKKLLKEILQLNSPFNPAELLMKTNVMFNEILRICDSLSKKNILKKDGKSYLHGAIGFAKNISELNYYGQQKFEEVSYDIKEQASISISDAKTLFSLFGTVENVKEIFLLKYVGK